MRLSGRKAIFVIGCFLISFLLYTAYVAATIAVAGLSAIVTGFSAALAGLAQMGVAIVYLSVAVLLACLLFCFLLMSPIDLAVMLAGLLPLLRAFVQ